MTWLKSNALEIVLVLAAIGAVSGWTSSARYKGMADAHEARAEAEAERADSIQAIRLADARADSIRTAALKDSADARVARAEEARRREAEQRERRERARAQALRSAADLRETLDTLQVPLFDAYVADRDVEVATLESELGSVRMRLEEAETENASLWEAMRAKDRLYEIAADENDALRSVNESLRSANDALRRANSAGGIFPDFGDLTKPVYMAAGALLGWGGAKLTQSGSR